MRTKTPTSEFVDYLHEVFELFCPINARKMFGGYGLYHQKGSIALLARNDVFACYDP